MDPYLESPAHWSDFHGHFVPQLAEAINQRLPDNYVARIGEHVSVVMPVSEPPGAQSFLPDVTVIRSTRAASTGSSARTAIAAPPEPVMMTNVELAEEHSEAYVRIVRLPAQELVTVLELISPTNKYGDGRGEYMRKRHEFLRQPVNLVELDLLRAGVRVAFARPLPPAHYYAFVSRSSGTRVTGAYAWTVRYPFPRLPIPLRTPDPDVVIDLNEPFAAAYNRGRYWKLIKYADVPPPPPFGGEDANWVSTTARGGTGGLS
jgi:hypothetical protein